MAGESFTNATAWTLASQGFLVHTPSGSSPDTTPPAQATLAYASRTATTISGTHTPPADADYATTEVYAISIDGGAQGNVSLTSADTTWTIPDLTPGCTYIIVYWTEDATGNKCDPSVLGRTYRTTSSGSTTTSPMEVRWWRNRDNTVHASAPWNLDPELAGNSGRSRLEKVQLHCGQVHNLRLQVRCRAPVNNLEIMEMALNISVPESRPHGHRGSQ